MKNLIYTFFSCILLISCSSFDSSKKLNIKKAELAKSKFNNMSNNFSYERYKSLILEYAKNSKFPEIK